MTEETEYKLIGLNRCENGLSATLSPIGKDDSFIATISRRLNNERLWMYCKDHWNEEKVAIVEHNGLDSDGIPKGVSRVIEIKIK